MNSRRIGWAMALAGIVLLGAGALCARAQKPGEVGYPYGDLKEVTLQGRLLSLGELLARKYGARTAGGGPEKQWALVLPEGEIYTFLDNEGYRKLLASGATGQPIEVHGQLFPRSHLLEVLTYRRIAAEAVKRRFYCDICGIYTDEFGPCACCGREVKVVPAQPPVGR